MYGNTRAVTPTTKAIEASHTKYLEAMSTGKYDKNLSFFNSSTGGFLLYSKDRTMDNMEYNAATLMAVKGYQMTMTAEGRNENILIMVKGNPRYGDGRIAITPYEQRSPKAASEATARVTAENAINHARKKGASIALIFDFARSFKLTDIQHATTHYEKKYNGAKYNSVKTLIVVSGSGNVHEWELYKKKMIRSEYPMPYRAEQTGARIFR